MVCFGIETKHKEANAKVAGIALRLRSDNLIKNPFTSRMKQQEPGLWVINIEPIYPPVGRLFMLPLLPVLVWPGSWVAWAGGSIAALMFSINLWWTKSFYYLMFLAATRGGVKYVSPERLIERVV